MLFPSRLHEKFVIPLHKIDVALAFFPATIAVQAIVRIGTSRQSSIADNAYLPRRDMMIVPVPDADFVMGVPLEFLDFSPIIPKTNKGAVGKRIAHRR